LGESVMATKERQGKGSKRSAADRGSVLLRALVDVLHRYRMGAACHSSNTGLLA
jgi:hypothetical protein